MMTNEQFKDLFLFDLDHVMKTQLAQDLPQLRIYSKKRYDDTQVMISALLIDEEADHRTDGAYRIGMRTRQQKEIKENDIAAVFLTMPKYLPSSTIKSKGKQVHQIFGLGYLGHTASTSINQKASKSIPKIKIEFGFKQDKDEYNILRSFYEGFGSKVANVVLYKDLYSLPQLIEHLSLKGGE